MKSWEYVVVGLTAIVSGVGIGSAVKMQKDYTPTIVLVQDINAAINARNNSNYQEILDYITPRIDSLESMDPDFKKHSLDYLVDEVQKGIDKKNYFTEDNFIKIKQRINYQLDEHVSNKHNRDLFANLCVLSGFGLIVFAGYKERDKLMRIFEEKNETIQ